MNIVRESINTYTKYATIGIVLLLTLFLGACSVEGLLSDIVTDDDGNDEACPSGTHKDDGDECVLNQYICSDNGTPFVATPTDSPDTHNEIEKCGSCDDGFVLNTGTFLCVTELSYVTQPFLNGSPSTDMANITLTPSEKALLWWAVYSDDPPITSSETLMADVDGDGASGTSPIASGKVIIDGTEPYTIALNTLSANTTYSVYAVIQKKITNEALLSTKVDFATATGDIPSFNKQPVVDSITQTTAEISLEISEQSQLYWVVYNARQDNLTAENLIAVVQAQENPPAVVKKSDGSVTVDATNPFAFTVSGLSVLSEYFLYAVLQDSDNNLSISSEVSFDTIGYSYVCDNGTPFDGYNQSTPDITLCFSCKDGFLKSIEQTCVTAYDYVCENGTPIDEKTIVPESNHCKKCDDYYLLDDNHACVATTYVCDNGNPITTGTPQSNGESITDANVNKCDNCSPGYQKDGDSCVAIIDITIDITAVSDSSMATRIAIDLPDDTTSPAFSWVLYSGEQNTKTSTQIATDAANNGGVARGSSATPITQDIVIPINVDSLDASTTYTLTIAVGIFTNSLVFNTHGPNSKHGVDFDVYCNIESGYVPTDFSDNITGTNGATPAEEWTPTFNELGKLPNGYRAQRDCYKYAYYYRQSLPDVPPETTTAHTNSLPSGMYYSDKSKYKLVFEEDFGPNTASNPHNTHNKFKIGTIDEEQVNLYKIFEGLQNNSDEELEVSSFSGHGGNPKILWPGLGPNGNEPSWLAQEYDEDQRNEIRAALQNEWAWPAFIKDGRFHYGMGRVSLNHVGNNDTFYCRTKTVSGEEVHTRKYHNFNSDPFSLNSEVDTCECDADTADGCTYFFGSWDSDNIKFQYGFLELDIAEMMLSAGRGSSRSIYNFMHLPSATNHTRYDRTGTWPQMFNTHTDEGYFELWPVELQLMEHFISNSNGGRSGWWLVKHFYPPSRHPTNRDLRHSRFYDTYYVYGTRTNPYQKKARKLGIEWTPRGYRVWEALNGGSWVDLSTTSAWRDDGACAPGDKVNGFWQCGISHVVASIKHSGTGGTAELMKVNNPRYVFNHIRIYQPEGNYSELERIYK